MVQNITKQDSRTSDIANQHNGFEILDEILISDSELSEQDADLINILKIQNKIDDIITDIANESPHGNFKLKNATPKQLNTIAFLATRIHTLADKHNITDLQETCKSTVGKIGGIVTNIDNPQMDKRLLKNDTPEWVLGGFNPVSIRYRLKNITSKSKRTITDKL